MLFLQAVCRNFINCNLTLSACQEILLSVRFSDDYLLC
jgi:hypothetical protein